MTWEQKVWKHGLHFLYAVKPFLFYAFVPVLLARFGQMFRVGTGADLEEFLRVSRNFYLFTGHLLVWWYFVRQSRRQGTTLCAQTGLYLRRGEVNLRLAMYCFFFGMAAALFFSAVVTLLPMPGWLKNSYHSTSAPMYGQVDVLLLLPLSAFIAPLLEEMVMRGFMLSRLLEHYSVRMSVWITSLVFAVCHGNLVSFIYALFMGLAFAWIDIKMDNIAYSIVMHIGFNSLAWINTVILLAGVQADFFGTWYLVFLYGAVGAMSAWLIGQKIQNEEEKKL